MNWDYKLFLDFNQFAGKSHSTDQLIIFLAQYLVYLIGAALVLWWFFGRNKTRTRKALLMAFISFVLARFVVADIIRAIYHRQRPFLAHHVTELIDKGTEASFPSGHATALFAIATALYFYNKRAAWVMFVLAVIVSIARIMAGIHYPADILGGLVVGVLTAWVVEALVSVKIDPWVEKFSRFSDKFLPFTKR